MAFIGRLEGVQLYRSRHLALQVPLNTGINQRIYGDIEQKVTLGMLKNNGRDRTFIEKSNYPGHNMGCQVVGAKEWSLSRQAV